MIKLTDLLRELSQIDFNEGVLVEYKDGFGFDFEYGRAIITKVDVRNKKFTIQTDGDCYLDLSDLNYIKEIKREGDVFYLDIPILFNYALAPKGINIPKKPTLN